MPPVEEFDALLNRRVQVWTTAAKHLGANLHRVFAYADVAREVPATHLDLPADPSLQQLQELGLFSYHYGSNLAHGLALALEACSQDGGAQRVLLIASSIPNTVMTDNGQPAQSFPAGEETVAATKAAMDVCAGVGLRVDVVTIVGYPERFGSPFAAAALLAGMTKDAGGFALTLLPGDSVELHLERALNRWYG